MAATSCATITPPPTDAPPPAKAEAPTNAPTPAATLEAGLDRLRAGDPKGSVEILTEVTRREPEHGEAWLYRGVAEGQTGDSTAAIASLEHAAAIEDTRARALYQLAVAHGRQGHTELALEHLEQAARTGVVDVTGFATTPGLEALGDDPRLRALLPGPEALDDPFVEEVRVLRQWRGEAGGDQFGWIARNIGDVDGDGMADVVTSAPTNAEGGPGAGKVYVYSSRTGALRWARTGAPGGGLGLGVEAAGDVNADGIPDVIASAPNLDTALVLSGKDGSTLLELHGQAEGDAFGRNVSDVGDVNADGHADVLVGAPGHDAARGSATLFSGKDGAPLTTVLGSRQGDRFGSAGGGTVTARGEIIVAVGAPDAGPSTRGRVLVYAGRVPEGLTQAPRFELEPEPSGAEFGGMFVSIVGDVDGDGTPDVLATDWADAAKGPTTGRAYVWSGASGARIHVLTGEAAGDGFGIGVADAGDLDGDGRTELVIGAWQHAGAAPAGGKVYLFRADGSAWRSYTAKVMGETFGFDATGLGDVDGDGVGDLLLTSAWAPTNGPRAGRVFVIAGPS